MRKQSKAPPRLQKQKWQFEITFMITYISLAKAVTPTEIRIYRSSVSFGNHPGTIISACLGSRGHWRFLSAPHAHGSRIKSEARECDDRKTLPATEEEEAATEREWVISRIVLETALRCPWSRINSEQKRALFEKYKIFKRRKVLELSQSLL